MKTRLNIILLCFIQALGYAQCIEGNGNITTSSVTTNLIEHIKISAAVDMVHINEGSTQSISLNGDSNILDSLDVIAYGDSLVIDFPSDTCYGTYTLNITITTPNVKTLNFEGVGNVSLGNFSSTAGLVVSNTGAGNVTVESYAMATALEVINDGSGDVSILQDFPELNAYKVQNNGSGNFNGCQLSVDSCWVDNYGSGLVTVSASQYLFADLYGSGDLVYYGSPDITQNVLGTGELIVGNPSDCVSNLSVNDVVSDRISVYPNPTNGRLTISGVEENSQILIYSITGELVTKLSTNNKTYLDLSYLENGVYVLKAGNDVLKFIKN